MAKCEKYRTSKFPNFHKKYRSHFEIIVLMLEAAKGDGASQSSIIRYVGINHKHLKKYLGSLTDMGFVDVNIKKGHVLYRVNEKGIAFLKQYYVLMGMLLDTCTRNNQLTLPMKLNMHPTGKKVHQCAL